MGAAGNKKPKGMHKKHAPAYQVEEAIHENDLKKGKKKYIRSGFIEKGLYLERLMPYGKSSDITLFVCMFLTLMEYDTE